ncbi:MAG TPA: AMP-binding protein, partial [Polyangiales bacterium]|nr:AMP-binding protein [Polyangiales bacterium]
MQGFVTRQSANSRVFGCAARPRTFCWPIPTGRKGFALSTQPRVRCTWHDQCTTHTTVQTGSPQDLIDLASGLSHELHPARRRAHYDLRSTLDRDLGLDSLARTELLLRIERELGPMLSDKLLTTAETLGDIWSELERAGESPAPSPRRIRKRTREAESALALPDAARSLVEVLQFHAAQHGSRVHLLFDEGGEPVALSYAELLERASRVAAGLRARGLESGDRVAIMLPTCLSYFVCFFGTLLAGLTPVPLYPPARLTKIDEHMRRQAGILRNARAALLVTTREVEPLAQLLSALVEGLAIATPEALESNST